MSAYRSAELVCLNRWQLRQTVSAMAVNRFLLQRCCSVEQHTPLLAGKPPIAVWLILAGAFISHFRVCEIVRCIAGKG